MIETFIKPMIYNKNRPGSAEQIAGGTYKNFDYYVLNLKTHPTAYTASHFHRISNIRVAGFPGLQNPLPQIVPFH